MLNLGIGEIILIAVVAMVFIPPEKLPRVATTLGRWMAKVQKGFSEMKQGITQSVEKEAKDIKEKIQLTRNKSQSEPEKKSS